MKKTQAKPEGGKPGGTALPRGNRAKNNSAGVCPSSANGPCEASSPSTSLCLKETEGISGLA